MNLAAYIDHTLLRPQATVDDIKQICQEAAEHEFAAVCVNLCYADLAAHLLTGTAVKVATVIGFPLGATLSTVKAFEAKEAIDCKADELDMVMNIGAAKIGRWDVVVDEIRQIVTVAEGKLVKVVIETALLSNEEKKLACRAVIEGGAHFVKTSTGFGPGGATIADVKLLSETVRGAVGVKASGGIRTRAEAEDMIAAGATRIGTSAGIEIISEFT